jgi:hypothetical protein
MRKLGILIILIYSFSNLYSQDKVSISFNFSPILSYRILNSNVDSLSLLQKKTNSYINGRNKVDNSLLGLKIGFNLYYDLNTRFSIYSGLNYIYQRISQSTLLPIAYYTVNGDQISFSSDKFYSLKNSEHYYLSVPFGLKCNFLNQKSLNFSIFSGFSFDYLIHSKLIDHGNPYIYDNNLKINDFTSEFNLGLYCNYMINNNFNVFFKPNFNIFIIPNIIEYNVVRQYNYYYAFELGIKYKINSH